MERSIDNQLEDLKKLILHMGGHVEKALGHAMNGVMTRDLKEFVAVHEVEKEMNQKHLKVDEACLGLLAKQGPVARDLRLILSIIKINTDLERMGDQSVNIAYTGKDYLERKSTVNLQDISSMSNTVRVMVKESLDSFVRGDVEQAKKILLMDDEVDRLRNKVFADMIADMKKNTDEVEACLDIILIARNLERLGDHATNIAEDVIFAFTGKDVRHGGGNFG